MTDEMIEPADSDIEPVAEQRPEYSAELIAFATRLKAEPEAVQAKYQYCLVTWQEQHGLAKLTQVELRGRQAWCTYKLASGDEITLLRPSLTSLQEQEMIDLLREIFPQVAVEMPPLPANIISEAIILPPPPEPSPPTAEVTAEAAEVEQITARNMRNAREAAQALQQMVEQARVTTYTLKKVIAETQQVTQAAREAITEQRLLLVELRGAIRRYERTRRDAELAPYVVSTEEAERRPYKERALAQRDKQAILSILRGTTLKEVAQTFNVSDTRIKQIFTKQINRLYRISERLGLGQADLDAIKAQEQAYLSSKARPDPGRVIELLEHLWGSEGA